MIRQPGPQAKPPAWARTYLPDAVLMVRGVSLPTIVIVTRYRSFKGVLAGHLAAALTLASPGA